MTNTTSQFYRATGLGTTYVLNDPTQPDTAANEIPITVVDNTGNYYENSDPTTLYDNTGTVINDNYVAGSAQQTATAAPASQSWWQTGLTDVGNFFVSNAKNSVTPATGAGLPQPIVSSNNTLGVILTVLGIGVVTGIVIYIEKKRKKAL